jgi:transcription elongation factor Elf1
MRQVRPIRAEGFNLSLLQIFGAGPKWTITCGSCGLTFKKRIPMIDRPGIDCPKCGAINVLPIEVE